ncbi:GGDEF domain-containing protein [Breznakiella homolactica]|uniref:diguanylate cyclase n=1 Tax=Breznakiella homolactica TaxID=2798577 RepID=A0A7T7XNP5_9SPIR|nr:GGDEF domain-containing protein [Breznakiella homolactica]QQO09699.1 GGDEF domain-containing protein [Breznakiella homolactica]
MNNGEHAEDFLTSPKVLENYTLLQDIGVFKYIDEMNREIRSYKSLLGSAADIFNRTTINDIMDATVWQISDQFLPSFIVFLWRPLHNREEITIKGYKNYKMIDLSLDLKTISPFEAFFQKYPKPINFDLLVYQLADDEAIKPLEELHPEIVVPILGPSGLYCLILIGPKMLGDEYSSRELSYLGGLMGFVSQAIQNHLHYEHSVRDVKTGLFNHGFFISRMNEEIARTKRFRTVSSLIVMDVDKFKNFNDSYGHLAGDRVLEYIGRSIKKSVRSEDIPSRFGGEEFTILLPNTGKEMAWTVAERLRMAISGMKVPWVPPLPQVTISAGVITFDERSGMTADEIINRADEALYLSKARGRNMTTVWGMGLLFRIERELKRQREMAESPDLAAPETPDSRI